MSKRLCFTSSKFPPFPGEDEKTNTGVFGLALARWIREKLISYGHRIIEEPIPEDWGWVVMVQRKPYKLWVGCGNEVGNSMQWGVFVEAEPGLLHKLLKRGAPSPSVATLEHQLEKIVMLENECQNVKWE